MRKKYIFSLILLGLFQHSYGQKNWEEKYNGLVITEDNSVIRGYLMFSVGTREQGTKIKLLKKPNDNPQIFYTLELKGYVYKKDTFKIIQNLQPYQDDNKVIKKAEARIAERGKLVLYEIPEIYYSNMPIYSGTQGGTSSMVTINKNFIYVIQNAKGEMIGIKKDNFIETTREILFDAPDILQKIQNKDLKFRDLELIIKDYNQKFR